MDAFFKESLSHLEAGHGKDLGVAFVKDLGGTIVECNQYLCDAAKETAVIGKTDYQLRWDFMAPQYCADDQKVFQGYEITRIEPFLEEDKYLSLIEMCKTSIRDAFGHVIGLVGHGRILGKTTLSQESLTLFETFLPSPDIQKANQLPSEIFFGLTREEVCSLFPYSLLS